MQKKAFLAIANAIIATAMHVANVDAKGAVDADAALTEDEVRGMVGRALKKLRLQVVAAALNMGEEDVRLVLEETLTQTGVPASEGEAAKAESPVAAS